MEYKHFSHQHNLNFQQLQTHEKSGSSILCSGCELPISESATSYLCATKECNFGLHDQCGNAARGIHHPSHALHHLTLVPYTTYSAGTFLCGACGSIGGKSLSYCCPLCDFDLHVQCANLPQVTVHESHPLHSLLLVYNSAPPMSFTQFGYTNQLVCSLCNMIMDSRFWSYNCYACNYHIHASCAVNKPKSLAAAETSDQVASGVRQADEGKIPNTESSVSGEDLGTEQTTQTAEVEDPVLRQQLELQKLQLQLDMSSALANMMGSFNLSSFV